MIDYLNSSVIRLPDAELQYFESFYSVKEADSYFEKLKKSIAWQSYKIKVFGKIYDQPRLTAFYNDSENEYSYSKIRLKSQPLNSHLIETRNKIFNKTGIKFNSVLLNYYRNESDSNGWHADDEKELGINPTIASISLGAERIFKIKHNKLASEKYTFKLGHGSLLIMRGAMQHNWKHQIPKSKKKLGERINLTFRQL